MYFQKVHINSDDRLYAASLKLFILIWIIFYLNINFSKRINEYNHQNLYFEC